VGQDAPIFPSWEDNVPVVEYFLGNVYSFIEVYSNPISYPMDELKLTDHYNIHNPVFPFKGYKNIHCEKIPFETFCTSNELNSYLREVESLLISTGLNESAFSNYIEVHSNNPFAYWMIFEKIRTAPNMQVPDRFSLLSINYEGISLYKAFYVKHGIEPKILCASTGHGDFCGRCGFGTAACYIEAMAEVVLDPSLEYVPDYVVTALDKGWDVFSGKNKHRNIFFDEYPNLIWQKRNKHYRGDYEQGRAFLYE
jgi:hypothetical protein